MEYTMVQYIKEQPEVLKKIADDRKRIAAKFVELYTSVKPDCIYLFGSGTAFNSVNVTVPFMQKILGVPVQGYAASQMTEVQLFAKKPLFCAISQGGSSTNTIKAIEKFKAEPMIVVTADLEATMANRYPDKHVLLECGEEMVGPKTKGYTSGMLTFYIFALEAGLAAGTISQAEYDAYIAEIYEVCDAMTGNVEKTFAWFEKNKEELKKTNAFVIFGKDEGARMAVESALKILETVRYPAMHYEFEEYLHGPIMMGDEKLTIIGCLPLDEDGKRAHDLIKLFYNDVTKLAFAVMGEEDPELPNALVLDIAKDQYFAPFAHILPGQVISALLPEAMGRDGLNIDQFKKVDSVVHTKDRMPKEAQ